MEAISYAIYYVFWYRLSDPSLYLLHSPLVAVAAIECLIAIWAAKSRAHWLWRWLAVVGAVTLMVPARAWEAAWFFGLSLPLVVALLRVPSWGRRRREEADSQQSTRTARLRFSLLDLFLVTVAVAAALPLASELARHFRPFNAVGWIASSFAMSVLAVICCRCVTGPRRRMAATLLLVAIPVCAVIVRFGGDWANVWDQLGIFHDWRIDIGTFITLETQFVLVLLVALALMWACWSPVVSQSRRIAAGGVLIFVFAEILGWGGWFYTQFLKPIPPMPQKFAATPNHYDRIVAIANRVTLINKKNVSIAELNETGQRMAAQEMEALYSEVLALLEAANAIPYDPQTDARKGSRTDNFWEVQPLRALCRTFTAEAKSAMKNGESAKAVEYSTASMRVGGMLGRGGVVIQAIIGVAAEGVGYAELARIREQLNEPDQRAAIAALQRLLAEREDTKTILDRDADFQERAYGFPDRLGNALYEVGSANWGRYRIEEYARDCEATNLLLQTDLAIRLYQADHQRLPANLSELVPNCLPAVPIDPNSDRPLIYRLEGGEFVLYSVGFDRHDDGGRFGQWPAYYNARSLSWRSRRPTLDLNLDSLVEPEKRDN